MTHMHSNPLATRACAALLLACGASACGEPDVPSGPVRAQVLTYSQLDFATGLPTYELVERELETLESLERLEGAYHKVFRGGELVARDVAGSLVIGRFNAARDPELRYDVEDGTVVPRDYSTLVMLSAFHAFEQVVLTLDEVTSLTIEDLMEGAPLEVFFEPSIVIEGSVSGTQTLKFNAFYLPTTKQFGLAQRSPVEQFPLAASPLVIAHEFGHRVFDRGFFGDEETACVASAQPFFPGRLDLEYAISGLNEGFSDFFSFAVHGSVNPLGEYSFGQSRNFRDTNFSYETYDRECSGSFYCIGTLFARSLYEALEDLGLDPEAPEDRKRFAQEVYAALETTQANMKTTPELMPDASASVRSCTRGGGFLDYDGQVVGTFLRGFLLGIEEERRPALCDGFVRNFGTLGFPEEARDLCP